MRVFVLGADGQVGHELCGVLRCFCEVVPATEADFDITDSPALRQAIDRAQPHVIVNAAAYTDVDGAERKPDLAMRINADAVATLGEEAKRRGVPLIHYSTDFVFDGSREQPYSETDEPTPLNAYGVSKLAGERALLEQDAPAIIFRTAWVYSVRARSFVSTILRLARERQSLSIVSDQYGSPTFCRDLAEATALLLYAARPSPLTLLEPLRGLYHLCGTGSVSRYELARAVIELDPCRHEHIVQQLGPVSTEQYPLPARRPAKAVLDCSKARAVFGIQLPPWRASLLRALAG